MSFKQYLIEQEVNVDDVATYAVGKGLDYIIDHGLELAEGYNDEGLPADQKAAIDLAIQKKVEEVRECLGNSEEDEEELENSEEE